jgi:hypothetical protein
MESIFWYNTWDQEKIDEEIMLELFNEDTISYSKIKNNADVISIFYGYIYDLYFPATLEIISKEKYLDIFTRQSLQKIPISKNTRTSKKPIRFLQ